MINIPLYISLFQMRLFLCKTLAKKNAPDPCSYNVKLSDNRAVRCHADYIRSRSVDLPEQNPNNDLDDTIPIVVPGTNPPADNMVPSVPLRCSTRVSRPPDRLSHNI